jgi:hypothetical protein
MGLRRVEVPDEQPDDSARNDPRYHEEQDEKPTIATTALGIPIRPDQQGNGGDQERYEADQ